MGRRSCSDRDLALGLDGPRGRACSLGSRLPVAESASLTERRSGYKEGKYFLERRGLLPYRVTNFDKLCRFPLVMEVWVVAL